MKKMKKILWLLILVLCLSGSVPAGVPLIGNESVQAAVNLNKSKLTLVVGESTTLKVNGTTKKIIWSSSKKSVATVNSLGKVTAKKDGNATIIAKVDGKSYKCEVIVKEKDALSMSISELYTATQYCNLVMDTIYDSWYFQVYKTSEYNPGLLSVYSDYTGIPLDKVNKYTKEIYEETMNEKADKYGKMVIISVLSNNMELVNRYYTKNNTFKNIKKMLDDSKKLIKKLPNGNQKDTMTDYWIAVNNYYNFIYSPSGSFDQLGDTKSKLQADVSGYESKVEFWK